jgi:hypothetical protein
LADERTAVRIVEAYRDYQPPFDATKLVGKLLVTVPDKYLRGLDCILLTNASGLARKDRLGRVWSRKRKFGKALVLGRYHGSSRNSLPYIELRVDKIAVGLRRTAFLGITLLREVAFGHILFHEIGHHIHHTIRPQSEEKEDRADAWAGKLNGNFVRQHYWYVLPVLIPGLKVYKFLRRKNWIR